MRRADVRGYRNDALVTDRARGDVTPRMFERRFVARTEADEAALGGERTGARQAKTAARPCDDGDLLSQTEIHELRIIAERLIRYSACIVPGRRDGCDEMGRTPRKRKH